MTCNLEADLGSQEGAKGKEAGKLVRERKRRGMKGISFFLFLSYKNFTILFGSNANEMTLRTYITLRVLKEAGMRDRDYCINTPGFCTSGPADVVKCRLGF